MNALNYVGLMMLLLPIAVAWMLGRHDGPVTAAVLMGLVSVSGAYYVAAGALVTL